MFMPSMSSSPWIRGAPQEGFSRHILHLADQILDLTGNDRSSRLAVPHLPGPENTKALTMPGRDRLALDEGERRAPADSDAGEPDP
jgi:hypothetical protein